ncbi:SorA family sulfite dehydrogenase catalytic subunit [Sphingomonas sp. 35-24ZXX]|uniref:SorA family sulfite dehydrogenase catalytic subunit n=1 Tax=Sphingomonas sp. 35-24ZXX TaxID=1545915 RepID=UPI00053BE8AB|nr:molybdopterin-dependent oxidoreductase [Sphingomonas sp. 35-24ZXX]
MSGIDRRLFVAGAGVALIGAAAKSGGARITLPFGNGERPLITLPGKREMILLTSRPPQLETPFPVFNDGVLTPNDAFFVRYHLAGLPTEIDPRSFRLNIGGHVNQPLELSLDALRRDFPMSEIVAVNQCSGNSRGFVAPRLAGGQLGNGAMGNARWQGVALKHLLAKAGIRAGARQVTFNGLDNPPADGVADFVKALDLDHAQDGEVMVAFAMNGEELPFLNGYPLRLVVPGHYGTYWVKHLNEINVVDQDFDGYWMKTAYRIPDNDCRCVEPGTKPDKTRPIARFNVRSFLTSHTDGAQVAAGKTTELRGIAFAGGDPVKRVWVSPDDGRSWQEAKLGEDLGRYSFREWKMGLTLAKGRHPVRVRAETAAGEVQPLAASWQPAGYMRNVSETTMLEAV